MTVSDPGAGQQQGQDVQTGWRCTRCSATFVRNHRFCPGCRFTIYAPVFGPAPSPTPPARDSGRDEAREAVARWLWEQDGYAGSWEREDQQHYYREDADRLLALPELDKLLRRPA